MQETLHKTLNENERLAAFPLESLPARTLSKAASPADEITPPELKLLSVIQSAFSQDAASSPISLYLRKAASVFLFWQQGSPLPPARQDLPEGWQSFPAAPFRDAQILVQHADRSDAGRLAHLLVKNAVDLFESREREESLMEEVAANWESLDALCETRTEIFASTSMTDCIHRIVKRLGTLKEGFDGALFLQESDELASVVASDGVTTAIPMTHLGPLKRVLTDRKTTVMNGIAEGFFPAPKYACWGRARCLAAVPMLSHESVKGFVIVWSESPDKEIDTSFQFLIDALSNRISMLLECDALTQSVRNTELLSQELDIAATIHNTLLCGEVPQGVPGATFAALSIPSRNIGGDFYEFYHHIDGTIDILSGDVMGKGLAAALLGTAVKNEFTRAVVSQSSAAEFDRPSPDLIVQNVSKKLTKRLIELERFVTLCYARLSLPKRRLEYVDCGHTSTIVHRRTCLHSFVLEGRSLPLGVDVADKPAQEIFDLEPGDTILFYSDGVTENVSPSGEFYGLEPLTECIEQWSSCGPEILIDQLCRQALQHSGKAHFSDDFTAVAVKIGLDHSVVKCVQKARFQRELSELEPVRQWLTAAASLVGKNGLDEDDIARLLLVCIEAFDNCVIHSAEEARSLPVDLEATAFNDSLRVTFRHVGPEFDPFHAAPPSFDGSRDNGFGLYIMVRSSDEFAYHHEPEGINVLTISIVQRRKEMTCHADHDHPRQ